MILYFRRHRKYSVTFHVGLLGFDDFLKNEVLGQVGMGEIDGGGMDEHGLRREETEKGS